MTVFHLVGIQDYAILCKVNVRIYYGLQTASQPGPLHSYSSHLFYTPIFRWETDLKNVLTTISCLKVGGARWLVGLQTLYSSTNSFF